MSSPPPFRVSPSRVAASVALAGIAAALLAVVLREVDGRVLAEAWARFDRTALGWCLLAFAANHGLRMLRWHTLMAAEEGVSPRDSVVACLVGFLAVMLLPLRLGELVRPSVHARAGTPFGAALAALVVERTLDLAALAAGLVWLGLVPALPSVVVLGVDVIAAGRRSAGLGAAVLLVGVLSVAAVGPRAGGWPVVGRVVGPMGVALRGLGAAPGRALAAALLTVGTWSSYLGYVAAALHGFPGLPGGAEVAAVAALAISTGTTALPTPGFFGSYEASVAAALELYGAEGPSAAAFGLFLHVAYVGFVAAASVPALAALAAERRR